MTTLFYEFLINFRPIFPPPLLLAPLGINVSLYLVDHDRYVRLIPGLIPPLPIPSSTIKLHYLPLSNSGQNSRNFRLLSHPRHSPVGGWVVRESVKVSREEWKKKDNRGRKPHQRKAGTEWIVDRSGARFVPRAATTRTTRRESFERAHNLSPLPRTHENVYRDRWNNDRGRPMLPNFQQRGRSRDRSQSRGQSFVFHVAPGGGLASMLAEWDGSREERSRFNFQQGTKRVSRDVGGKNRRDPGRKGWRKVFPYFEIKENAERVSDLFDSDY